MYANDCDPMAHELAMKMRIERTYENTKLVPIKSKFKDLYEAMLSEGVEDNSLSGIIIGKNLLYIFFCQLFVYSFVYFIFLNRHWNISVTMGRQKTWILPPKKRNFRSQIRSKSRYSCSIRSSSKY